MTNKSIALASAFLVVMSAAMTAMAYEGKTDIASIDPEVAVNGMMTLNASGLYALPSYLYAAPAYSNKTRDVNTEKGSVTLFEGNITIPNNSHWSGVYDAGPNEAFLIYIKTDGKPVNLYILNESSFLRYLENREIYTDDYFQYNLIEGRYLWEGDVESTFTERLDAILFGRSLTEKRYVVIENLNDAVVSASLEVSKTLVSA